MKFERTFDYELIRSIITHPQIYPAIADDFSPKAGDYKPIESDGVWYVLVRDGDEVLGLWIFIPENGVTWKVHTCLLPTAWGSRAKVAAVQMAEWVWKNTPCKRIVTDVPEYNRLALFFALKAGMTRYGLNPKSYQKDGTLMGQVLLGLSKPGE